jgi:maltooligosyltrehalose trehalohydrolase
MTGVGALYDRRSGACTFRVWAPLPQTVEVKIVAPKERTLSMERDARGYWQATARDAGPGTRYYYRLDHDRDRPDPASRHQPGGVHGPSEVVDHGSFRWTGRAWKGLPLRKYVI